MVDMPLMLLFLGLVPTVKNSPLKVALELLMNIFTHNTGEYVRAGVLERAIVPSVRMVAKNVDEQREFDEKTFSWLISLSVVVLLLTAIVIGMIARTFAKLEKARNRTDDLEKSVMESTLKRRRSSFFPERIRLSRTSSQGRLPAEVFDNGN